MPQISINISAGYPSKHYPEAERAQTGATDFDVSITAAGAEEALVNGGITLWPDKESGGRMGSCGSPTEVWVSSALIAFLDGLTLSQRSQVFEALETGCSINLNLKPPFGERSRVQDGEDSADPTPDAGRILEAALTADGWRFVVGWDTGVRTTVGCDEICEER